MSVNTAKVVIFVCVFVVHLVYIFAVSEAAIPVETVPVSVRRGGCRLKEKLPDDREFRIAWLAPKEEFHNLSAATSVGALKLALAAIIQHDYLHGWQLKAKWFDTGCDSKKALAAAEEAVENFDPDVFIGPPCSTGLLGVAQLGSIWNLPVFGWVSDLLDFKDTKKYTTLVRFSNPRYAIAETMRQTGRYFGWDRYALIYDKRAPYEAVATALRESAIENNYDIISAHDIRPETKDSDIESYLLQIRKFARVIIFVVPWHSLRQYLLIAHELGMAAGDFGFICVHGDLFTREELDKNVLSDWGWRRNDTHDHKAKEIYESVIHIIMTPVTKDNALQFEKLAVEATKYNLPAWELPEFDQNHKPDAYAPYLFDATVVWAQTVNATLKLQGNPRNGKQIYNNVHTTVSGNINVTDNMFTGAVVFNPLNRDRMMNYHMLDMAENGTFYVLVNFTYLHGRFMSVKGNDRYLLIKKGRWPTGKPPPAIPKCGFDGCPEEENTATPVETVPVSVQRGGCRLKEKLPDDREFRIAWLAPKEEFHNLSAATSVKAFKLALAAIIHNDFLYGWELRAKWFDTACDSKKALAAAVEAMENYDPDVFIGPPCSTGLSGVAQLGSIWNLPVFGWVSDLLDSKDTKKYTTLVRFSNPLYATAQTVRQAGLYFDWNSYALIYDKKAPYEAVATALRESAMEMNYYIISAHEIRSETKDSDIESILLQIRKFARVIIFVVPWHSLRQYLLIAHELGMAAGDFGFICVHGDLFTREQLEQSVLSDWGWRRNDTHDHKAREIYESVIHIITAPLTKDNASKFENLMVAKKEINLPLWELPESNHNNKTNAYAPYLYDAAVVWAQTVNATLKIQGNPRDGTQIYNNVYNTVRNGSDIMFSDEVVFNYPTRDRLMNYHILDMAENGTFYVLLSLIYNEERILTYNTDDPKSYLKKGRWPTGKPPPAIPKCGFDGCPEEEYNSRNGTIIAASVSASVVLTLAIVVHIMLRRFRRQLHLQSMLWQVKFVEIDFVTALLTGSIRNSFKNLTRRKTSTKTMKKANSQLKGRNNLTVFRRSTGADKKNDGSSEFNIGSFDPDTMFGSVAFVRGNLTSVKRIQRLNLNITNIELLELNQLMEMKHQNLCAFVGACFEHNQALLIWEYCAKGSLQDVIWNQNIKLEQMFMFALSHDVTKGLEYIHKSSIHFHGNLRSTNCVVDSRWTCKLTDFGLTTIREAEKMIKQQNNDEIPADKLLWTAPECLREEKNKHWDRQKADVFALGIILKEIFTRSAPYTEYPFLMPHEIIEKVKCPVKGDKVFRPMLNLQVWFQTELTSLIDSCWQEDPGSRPNANRVFKTLNRINPQNLSMIDNMIVMLEKYANHLEELVAERTEELDAEKAKTETLLYKLLPQTVADELKLGRPVKAEHFDEVTLYFSDIVGFTAICASSSPIEVVTLLNSLYTLFDAKITGYDVYKVETIGDAYMIASGLPKRNGDKHIQEVADCAMDIMSSVSTFCIPHQADKTVRIRVGIHTGPVVAGVVGLAMPRYCLFGDTVNTASRMESTGLPLRIHLSSASKKALEMFPGYHLLSRGDITVKGKGLMSTYFLCGKEGFKKKLPQCDDVVDTHQRDKLCARESVTSINSMASLITLPSSRASQPKMSNASSTSSVTSSSDDWDRRYKSRQTNILEITCL